jgi:NAD(P)-dependent dehydrogenase (short-subunit alcohol dehydrogenase family)
VNEHSVTEENKMAWTTTDIPDLAGRTAVVTGANGGLGLETARALAAAGARVVMAARDKDKTAAAEAELRGALPQAHLEVVPLDLGSLASVEQAAAQITTAHPTIDILVNNAGLMAIPERRTADNFEMQFGVNHLGHFAFTAHLLPALLRADAARIVTVTSTAHHMGRRVDADNPHLEGRYRPWRAYGQSKLANYHFAIGLHRRLVAAGATTMSLLAHPGLSNTELQTTSVAETGGGASQKFFRFLAASTGMTPARGALPQLRAATDPKARSGQFYAPRFVNFGAPVRRPILRRIGLERSIATLWSVSERETGVRLDVADALAVAGR